MKPDQFIGYTLLNTTAVTAIVSTRINYGLRPIGTELPSINFYDLAGIGKQNGLDNGVYSINCRAVTARAARDLADIVITTFTGSDAMGVTGTASSFSAIRVSLVRSGGLIPEPDDSCYNAPVDIRVVS